jgi:uncharacterized tellurite resistance protein B-like protein
MLDRLKAMFAREKNPAREPGRAPLAVAALLVEAARADETYTDAERSLIEAALAAQFSLDAAGARALREEAEAAQADALDIHRFTRVAKTMDAEEKLALLERLWTIALSDGARDPHEDTLIRRVCGLIYVSDPESAAARKRAEIALKGDRGS